MGTEGNDAAMLYLGLGALFSGLAVDKIVKNKVKIENASLCALPALLLLAAFCHIVLPVQLGASVFIVACVLYYITLPVRRMLAAGGKSVLVTGCDSGLGHALAKHLDKQGLLVFAGVLNKNGPGAEELKRACSSNLCLIQLDVTNSEEISAAYCKINSQVKDTEAGSRKSQCERTVDGDSDGQAAGFYPPYIMRAFIWHHRRTCDIIWLCESQGNSEELRILLKIDDSGSPRRHKKHVIEFTSNHTELFTLAGIKVEHRPDMEHHKINLKGPFTPIVNDARLWAIVHNAGVLLYVADGELLPMNVYRKCMEVNFIGVVQVTKMFLPLLRKAKGRLVTISSMAGCDSGLGHALAKHLDKQGLLVFAGVLNKNGPGAEELKRACSSNLCLIQLDVTNSEEISAAYRKISSQVKDTGLWAIVHNAGVLLYVADGELLPMNVYRKCMEVNFIGVVQVTKMFLPLLRKAKGRLVTISSMAGFNPIPGFAAYAASKAAVTMFCAVMRQDLLKWGVKVSSIHPSGFKTNIFGSRELCLSQAQNLLENIKPDVRDDYGEDYLNALKDLHHDMLTSSSSDISPVLEDAYHALLAQDPYSTYTPGTFAYLIPLIFRYFPLWVYDTLAKLIFNNHRIMLPKSLRTSHNNNKTD
ncbi:17-beta-hydroxysteroid dehydrogenase type 2 [Mantella aurantiaca]